jgi:hypothetical protein
MTGRAEHDALAARFAPILDSMIRHATVAERFLDKDVYRILVCTLWANLVLNPGEADLAESELEAVHDLLNDQITEVVGADQNLKSCFEFLNGKAGERAMSEARLTLDHRDLLLFFASMILDPEGHRRWTDRLRNPSR